MQTPYFKAGTDFFKVRLWVGNRSGGKTSHDFVSQKVDLQANLRLAMKLTLDSKVHLSGSHKQSKFSLCTPFLLQVSK